MSHMKYTDNKLLFRAGNVALSLALKFLPSLTREPKLVSGAGCAAQLPEILSELKVSKVMIVSGPTVGRTIVPRIRESIEAKGIGVSHYSKVEANPSVETVEAIREQYLSEGCDGFLGIGGGSPMDAAKAAAARVAKPNSSVDKLGGVLKVRKKLAPLVCVPTTSGTGSEGTMGAVVSNHEKHYKYALMDSALIPLYAVLDPELTVGMPPFVTATTGLDALTHAVESYLSWNYGSDKSEKYAEAAVVDIFRYLERAYQDGKDMEAREKMLMASFRAGVSFNRGALGYVHSVAHAIGGIYGTAHGLANSVILPIVLEEYGAAVHLKLARLAELSGIKSEGSEAEKAAAFISAIRDMNKRLGLPTGFDFLEEKHFDQMTERAMAETFVVYSVPLIFNADRVRHILKRIKNEA